MACCVSRTTFATCSWSASPQMTVRLVSPWTPPINTVTSMLILSPASTGRTEGIPCTMQSLEETHTDLGKCMNPMGVGQAFCAMMVLNTNLSMSSSVMGVRVVQESWIYCSVSLRVFEATLAALRILMIDSALWRTGGPLQTPKTGLCSVRQEGRGMCRGTSGGGTTLYLFAMIFEPKYFTDLMQIQ